MLTSSRNALQSVSVLFAILTHGMNLLQLEPRLEFLSFWFSLLKVHKHRLEYSAWVLTFVQVVGLGKPLLSSFFAHLTFLTGGRLFLAAALAAVVMMVATVVLEEVVVPMLPVVLLLAVTHEVVLV
jgi:hypothetical protein